jgi:hypothetical protein
MLIISWIHNNTEQNEQNKFKLVSLRIPTMNAISNAMHMRNSKTIGDEPNANAPEPMLPILSLSVFHSPKNQNNAYLPSPTPRIRTQKSHNAGDRGDPTAP